MLETITLNQKNMEQNSTKYLEKLNRDGVIEFIPNMEDILHTRIVDYMARWDKSLTLSKDHSLLSGIQIPRLQLRSQHHDGEIEHKK